MDRSRYVVKKIPAEKVKTKRQVPPDNWEIIYGSYRENLRLCFLPIDEAGHGYWFGFESEIQKIEPVFKAKDYLKYKTLKNDNKNYESCNAQKKVVVIITSIFFHLIFSLNIIQDL